MWKNRLTAIFLDLQRSCRENWAPHLLSAQPNQRVKYSNLFHGISVAKHYCRWGAEDGEHFNDGIAHGSDRHACKLLAYR